MTEPELASEAEARALMRLWLRRADVWTGLVLAIVAAAMVAQALTFPLEGTYAGVKNAWYVSPALFPLMVGGMLFVLSVGLVGNGIREARRLSPTGRFFGGGSHAAAGQGGNALLVASLLAFFIVGLVPRVDFVIATALYLVVFMGVYAIKSPVGRGLLIACLGVSATAVFAMALAGAWPPSRSPGQLDADAVLCAVLVLAIVVFVGFARGAEHKRRVPVVASAIGTAVILSAVFKYGLLVPLPREGLGVAAMNAVADGLAQLFG